MKTVLGSILPRRSPLHAVWSFAFVCGLSGTACGQVVDVSNLPLYGGLKPHPNVIVAASVEFPTVGWAFRNSPTYVRGSQYLGYFNATKCYKYNNGSSGGPGVFVIDTSADSNYECKNGNDFSGNFMNWATMSGIDEFRYAMTGGNRVVDPAGTSGAIIQRAYLPDGTISGISSFYNYDFNYPGHVLVNGKVDGVASSNLQDVVPSSIGNNGDTIYIANCKGQIYFNKDSIGSPNKTCDSTIPHNKGAFDVRVQVCDSSEGSTRTDLCLNYGTASSPIYKPVGEAQRNAASMRFSIFGYLMDRSPPTNCNDGTGWNRCRYGGVMRASMKYLGPKKYSANLASSTNAASEINADGTLVANPDSNAVAGGTYSGFINYLNKFGSNGAGGGQDGLYKRHDPMGELFYEALRYYQHLGGTDIAASGMTSAMQDGFPVITTWDDPIISTCSTNYVVTIGDTNNSNDVYLPGFVGSPSASFRPSSSRVPEGGLDASLWTQHIGDLESTVSSLTPNDAVPNLAGLQTKGTGNDNTAAFFGAGAAYWANTQDIRTDLSGKQTVKTIAVDVAEPGSGLSAVTQQREIYLMGKYGGFSNTIDQSSDTYPNPFYGTNPANPTNGAAIRTNAEWQDSTGFPANYLLASDPLKLINGIRSAFATINTSTGTLSGAALTSANLTFGAAGAYVATFNPSKWSGSVLLSSLSVDSNGNLVVSTTPVWDSGSLLTARCGTVASGSTVCSDLSTDPNKRNILTTIKVAGLRTAAPFSLLGITPDLNYLAALGVNPATSVIDLQAGARINYLRGFRGDEGSSLNFRVRDSAMGDIVNSGPVYVGPPAAGVPDADFQTFYLNNANRTAMVYVGANDGMLHGIRATDGYELFSYVPGYSYPDLNDLTNPGYVHQVYVDTVPKVQDVKLNGTWKSVLVGANGNGVQGIFGLDVTDPTAFSTGSVLFEFSDADDADFGSALSPVEIAKLWVSGTAAAPVYRYFAVVTGYNNTRTSVNNRTDSNVSTNTNQQGVMFLIALDHTLGTNWTLNADYYKFTFPATNPAVANGLGPATLLLSKSGDLSTVAMYFGDLQGNLWKLNTASGNPSTWASALTASGSPSPIFVAQDGSGNRQPITARPELAGGPFGSTLVFFGTGKFVGQSDLSLPATVQSEYSLLDVNPSVLISRSPDLAQRTATVSGSNVTVTGSPFTYSGSSGKKGWYLDFPSGVSLGERSVTKPAIRTGLLTFTTLTLSNDLCTPGNGYIYQVNAITGLPINGGAGGIGGYASTVGIPGPPRVVDLTTTPGATQATGEVINKKTQVTLVAGTAGKIGGYGGKDPTTNKNIQVANPPTQQINWREITNWNDKTGH